MWTAPEEHSFEHGARSYGTRLLPRCHAMQLQLRRYEGGSGLCVCRSPGTTAPDVVSNVVDLLTILVGDRISLGGARVGTQDNPILAVGLQRERVSGSRAKAPPPVCVLAQNLHPCPRHRARDSQACLVDDADDCGASLLRSGDFHALARQHLVAAHTHKHNLEGCKDSRGCPACCTNRRVFSKLKPPSPRVSRSFSPELRADIARDRRRLTAARCAHCRTLDYRRSTLGTWILATDQ